jgi:hypothetical protein
MNSTASSMPVACVRITDFCFTLISGPTNITKIRVLCLHVKIKDSVITTDQRSDVPVRMVGQEINVKQKLVVILALVMETENVVYLNIIQFVIVMQDGKTLSSLPSLITLTRNNTVR